MAHARTTASGHVDPNIVSQLGPPIIADIRNHFRVRSRLRAEAVWRAPTAQERARYGADPRWASYADFFEAVCDRGSEFWLLFERAFFGWPDPPPYAFFVLGPDGEFIAGTDLNQPPRGWRLPVSPEPQ